MPNLNPSATETSGNQDACDFSALITLLDHYLSQGTRVSEFDLMRWLQAPERAIFRSDALSDPLTLFRSHFILMHCLYRLRRQWHEQQKGGLEISALAIYRTPYRPPCHTPDTANTDRAPAHHDSLAAYYLDLSQLNTGREDVESLLRSFWQSMLLPDTQHQDLELLELEEPVDAQQIRRQYRRLAMQHHPDRGGDQDYFCRLQAAFQRLKTRYS
ncbi:MAG: molecular chaperone DnaJ [Oceanospirillaceae bacterium]|uniref:DNA-J related domain-containing protein n=1 Tax=Marinobacter nauticus TaxID=2743 RepID=UPI000C695B99|nr:molecular chaperone DnaJ [Oceanospirillaceae bacterium]MBT12363.1 molecular chaperone DnaJ [Oceanospirillaceae bacterium]|tara:strand:- start:56423 stop:57067 length:645 start_codon:yes stop_codon:yes gene_type:complete